MTTLTISIIVVFVLGYALIATESLTKVNKAAIALLMLVGCWTLYMMDPMQYLQLMHPDYTGGAAGMVEKVTGIIQEHLGDTATTLFFLMGAMTIVEIVDQNGGFNWVRKVSRVPLAARPLMRISEKSFSWKMLWRFLLRSGSIVSRASCTNSCACVSLKPPCCSYSSNSCRQRGVKISR